MTTTTKSKIDAIFTAANLDQLLEAVQDAEAQYRKLTTEAGHQDDPEAAAQLQLDADELQHALEQIYCDLPTWGPTPDDTEEVYSWDETRLLVGTDAWHIVNRDES